MLFWISNGIEYFFVFSFSYFSLFFVDKIVHKKKAFSKRTEKMRTVALNINVEAICTCLVGASDQSVLCIYLSYCVFGTTSAYLLLIFKRSTVGAPNVPKRKYCRDQSFLLE